MKKKNIFTFKGVDKNGWLAKFGNANLEKKQFKNLFEIQCSICVRLYCTVHTGRINCGLAFIARIIKVLNI